jgi:hypothetical protein
MLSSRWKQWTDHYARSSDWPKIRTMRESKAKLILDLEEARGDPLIEPFRRSIDSTIADAREELNYLDRVLERAPFKSRRNSWSR